MEIIKDLEKKMEEAAQDLRFEEAARLGPNSGYAASGGKAKIENDSFEDRDVVGLATDKDLAVAQVFFVRGGKVVGREHFFLTNVDNDQVPELLGAFLQQYYGHTDELPREIIVQSAINDEELVEQWLTMKRGRKVKIHVPKRGDKKRLMNLVVKNAEILLSQHRSMRDRRKEAGKALSSCVRSLTCPRLPIVLNAKIFPTSKGQIPRVPWWVL